GGQTINGGTQINDELTLQDNPVDANSITIEGILDKVDGPLVSTINALPRYETTGGKLLKNSNVTVDDLGNMTIPGTVDGRNVSDDGSKLDGIESGADVTDTDNVTSAGAIMQTLVDVAGDLIVADADNSVVRLPPGSEGEVLEITAGVPAWGTPAGGGDVSGPVSSTDNAMALWDGVGGDTIKNSVALVDVSGNISTPGTVDGRDLSVDGAKLDGIEPLADVTDTANVTAAGAEMLTNKDTANGYPGLDGTTKLDGAQQVYGTLVNTACEGNDTRLSNARTPTLHSLDGPAHSGTLDHTTNLVNVGTNTHAQIDTHIGAANPHSGSIGNDIIDAAGDLIYGTADDTPARLPIGSTGQSLIVSGGGLPTWSTPAGGGDVTGPASSTDNAITRFDGVTGKLIQNSSASIDDSGNLTTTGTVNGRDTAADGTKLDGIEALADVTDATNVEAAGAIMETLIDAAGDIIYGNADNSAVRLPIGLTGQALLVSAGGVVEWGTPAGGGDVSGPASSSDNAIPRFDGTSGTQLQNSGVSIDDSNNMTTPGTIDGRDVSADGSKLDGIEVGADVTDATNVLLMPLAISLYRTVMTAL
ncbi:MAG: hypothetical protein ACYS7Y_35895, partial [Planctomycetota bacterium]